MPLTTVGVSVYPSDNWKVKLILFLTDVTRHNEMRYKSEKFNQIMQTEAGDFSIKFVRYRSTTSQRAEAR